MDIRKGFIATCAIALFVVTSALAFPRTVAAVSIGEAVVQRGVAGAILVQVGLMVGSDERIEDSCLSLVLPDPIQEDVGSFLTEASLSYKDVGKRQYVDISSPNPLKKEFTKIRLQVKCPGARGVVKTLAIAPSVEEIRKKQNRSASVPREIVGGEIGESSAANINAEELALMRAQQKLLVDSFLVLQDQLALLQEELREIKLQLTQQGVNSADVLAASHSAVVATASMPSAAQLGAVGPQKNSAADPPPSATQQSRPSPESVVLAALGLVLAILLFWLGLRYYIKAKPRIESQPQRAAVPISKTATDVVTPASAWVSPSIKQPSHGNSESAPSVFMTSKANAVNHAAAYPFQHSPMNCVENASEEDLMLEEAALYAANGHLTKAVEILLEIVKLHPSKVDAWPLLLSLYSSLGKVAEFENTAREFLMHHKDSPLWGGIQVLGRTLDHSNPLYADHSGRISDSPLLSEALNLRHPIGDILVEMGALSKQDILNYLDSFDPKKHGRFGGYLVARKAITLAQLDAALQQQAGNAAEVKHGAIPSLQEIENFLENFDPKQHGSVAKFMASRNADTPEQLRKFLQQQSSHGGTAKMSQADISSHVETIPAS